MSRAGEIGIVRGCCIGLIVLVVIVGGSAFLADRALAAPELGRSTRRAVARRHRDRDRRSPWVVRWPSSSLVGAARRRHLSEQDLTVLAVANNPHPNQYRDLQVRVRYGLVVASARIDAGPFTPTVVAHVGLTLRPGPHGPVIAAQVPEIDVGLLGAAGIRRRAGLVSEIDAALSLDRLFAFDPRLSRAAR